MQYVIFAANTVFRIMLVKGFKVHSNEVFQLEALTGSPPPHNSQPPPSAQHYILSWTEAKLLLSSRESFHFSNAALICHLL